MRADIHDGPEHNTLQAEAGYIDARPYLPDRRNLFQRTAGPYIWVRIGIARFEHNESALLQSADMRSEYAKVRVGPIRGISRIRVLVRSAVLAPASPFR